MVKFTFIWKTGDIIHVIAINRDMAWRNIPQTIKTRNWFDDPVITSHWATEYDYNNLNCIKAKDG